MRIAIAGGHGTIALQLTRLLGSQHEVFGLVRNPAHEEDVVAAGGHPIRCDLESMDVPTLVATLPTPLDAVLFAAGSGPDSGPESKMSVDYEGATKLLEAAQAHSIPRYLIISSMGADPEHEGEEVFDVYLRAKGMADRDLVESGIDYTIVRPGKLTDDPGSGKVELAESVGGSEIPRADVAAVLAGCLTDDLAHNATFEVVAGDTQVPEALAAL